MIGVIQLINKKRDPEQALLTRRGRRAEQVVAFDERSEELSARSPSQAGIALENAILYAEIRRIFEGFVRASVEAIEQRDPTTSGHSRRVAELTVRPRRAPSSAQTTGPYREVRLDAATICASSSTRRSLHDFGKIGVREQVLVKAKKLYPHELELIRQRFEFAVRSLEVDVLDAQAARARAGRRRRELERARPRARDAPRGAARSVRMHRDRQRADACSTGGDFSNASRRSRAIPTSTWPATAPAALGARRWRASR